LVILEVFKVEAQVRIKPFLKWVGGKSQLLPEILRRLPRNYDRYFEPFVGGGAVFFSVRPEKAYLADINGELINTYTVIRDHVDELIADLKCHIHNKDYYYNIRGVDRNPEYQGWSNIQKASRFIYLNKTCFNGLYRVNSKQEFNCPMGSYKNPKIVDEESLRGEHPLSEDRQFVGK
jgi:DNA adenine methylase